MIIGISMTSLGLFSYESYQNLNELKSSKRATLEMASASILDKIDRNLFERYGDVQAFSMSEPARSLAPDRIISFVNDMMGAYAPIYDLMLVVDAQGKEIASNSISKTGSKIDISSVSGKSYANTTWFKKAMSGDIKAGASFVEDLYVDEDSAKTAGTNGQVMNFSSPIRDAQGKIIGVWTNRMSWTDVVDAIVKEETAKVQSDNVPQIWAYLVDANGRYMVHPKGFGTSVLWAGAQGANKVRVEAMSVELPDFKGNVYEAAAPSKGYASYPSRGWTMLMQVPIYDARTTSTLLVVMIAALLLISGSFASGLFVRRIVKGLAAQNISLNQGSDHVRNTSEELSSTAQTMAEASTEQAASLKETASAIEELTAMIAKSAANAGRSQDLATGSNAVASKGKQIVSQMLESMVGIKDSNAAILAAVAASNARVGDIVKVIGEIGAKTKVINEIVFQTKLLSFNASVEAARAGEHGKGFAVVAEEVGNLAQMSGNAAKDIADMLDASIRKVEEIVGETRSSLEKNASASLAQINTGSETAQQCGKIIDQVVSNITELNGLVTAVSQATHEQSQRVIEISSAMVQLDEATHSTAGMSEKTSQMATGLSTNARVLFAASAANDQIINGRHLNQEHVAENSRKDPVPTKAANVTKVRKTPEKSARVATNVVPISRLKSAAPAPLNVRMPEAKAIGSNAIPSEDDPRFRDV
jgi:methyl-accepting chemotaxis protein